MTNNQYPIAVRNPTLLALLKQDGPLDRRSRRQLEQFLIELNRRVKQAEASEDAISAIYLYAMWKADATLTAAELFKAIRSPLAPDEQLDALDGELRQRYLEQVRQIAGRGIRRVAGTDDD